MGVPEQVTQDNLPEPGDWVQVWAQVASVDHHPEDVCLTFESHNADYRGDIRLDHVVIPHAKPPFVRRCTRLHADPAVPGTDVLLRCIKHEGHARRHNDFSGVKWTEEESVGYFEER